MTAFLRLQRQLLIYLRDQIIMASCGKAKIDGFHFRGTKSGIGVMHPEVVESDSYDNDFALSLLSQEQDGLCEAEDALVRIENGTYGICEMCRKPIAKARLEAIPWTRFCVECKTERERDERFKQREGSSNFRPGNETTNNATQTPEAESEEIHHARILGLRGKVTFADISRHYRERMLEYHPDKVASLGLKLRELAERESKKINAAMEFFRNKYGPT
jgi:RNA polymerase-binding transcription factor DksA